MSFWGRNRANARRSDRSGGYSKPLMGWMNPKMRRRNAGQYLERKSDEWKKERERVKWTLTSGGVQMTGGHGFPLHVQFGSPHGTFPHLLNFTPPMPTRGELSAEGQHHLQAPNNFLISDCDVGQLKVTSRLSSHFLMLCNCESICHSNRRHSLFCGYKSMLGAMRAPAIHSLPAFLIQFEATGTPAGNSE